MNRGYPTYNRDIARYEHRIVSVFFTIQCWVNGWDGIRVSREQFKKLLRLEKFNSKRVEWMKQDFQELFPFQRRYYSSLNPSFELSRRDFNEKVTIGNCIIPEPLNSDSIDAFIANFIPTFNEVNTFRDSYYF